MSRATLAVVCGLWCSGCGPVPARAPPTCTLRRSGRRPVLAGARGPIAAARARRGRLPRAARAPSPVATRRSLGRSSAPPTPCRRRASPTPAAAPRPTEADAASWWARGSGPRWDALVSRRRRRRRRRRPSARRRHWHPTPPPGHRVSRTRARACHLEAAEGPGGRLPGWHLHRHRHVSRARRAVAVRVAPRPRALSLAVRRAQREPRA